MIKYNPDGIVRYANLLVSMEGMGRSEALKQAWRDAKHIARRAVDNCSSEYVCTFRVVTIPGVEWITPNQDWERYNASHRI